MLRRRLTIHPYRLLFWTALALLSVLALLHRYPIDLSAEDALADGAWGERVGRGDIAVVLHHGSGEGGANHGFAWVDLVEQEVGPVTIASVDGFAPELLSTHRVIILTRDAARQPAIQGQAEALDRFAAAGGTVFIEVPEGPLREAFGADGRGGWRSARAITAASGLSPNHFETLQRMPILVRFKGSTQPRAEAETLLAMDGAPVIYATQRGEGAVVVAEADFGALLTRLQRGVSDERGQVRPRTSGRSPHSHDLVADASMHGALVPLADLLERYLVHHVLSYQQPLFVLWPLPQGARGALILSHSASSVDGRPLWRSIHERSLQARTPTFVPAPGDARMAAGMHWTDEPGHAALLWHPYPDAAGLFQTWSLFGFTPIRRPLALSQQKEGLERWLGAQGDVRGVRTAYGLWMENHATPWRAMQAAGLTYSTSLAPSGRAPQGAVFGTCQPFRVTDEEGRPLRLMEVPICFDHPVQSESRELLARALERAAEDGWSVHLHTRSDGIHSLEDLSASRAWRDALAFAERHQLWIGSPGEFVTFRQRRTEAELRVRDWSVRTRMADGRPRVVEFVVEAATNHRGMHLVLPAHLGDLRFDAVHRGEEAAQRPAMADRVATQPGQILDREVRLLALHPGFTTVSIRYTR